MHRIAAGAERLTNRPAQVGLAAAMVPAEPTGAAAGTLGGDVGDQRSYAVELVGGHRAEVLGPQDLLVAPASCCRRLVGPRCTIGAAGSVDAAEHRALRGRRRKLERRDRRAQEPGLEGAVEDLELLAARDEVGAQRPVDVVLTRQVYLVEAAEPVGDAVRADLQSRLAQDAAERDDVTDDAANPRQPVPPRADRRARRRGRPAGPRGA